MLEFSLSHTCSNGWVNKTNISFRCLCKEDYIFSLARFPIEQNNREGKFDETGWIHISLLYEILPALSSATNRVLLPKLHLKAKKVIILHAHCAYILLGKIINIVYLGSYDPKVRSLMALADRYHEALIEGKSNAFFRISSG